MACISGGSLKTFVRVQTVLYSNELLRTQHQVRSRGSTLTDEIVIPLLNLVAEKGNQAHWKKR